MIRVSVTISFLMISTSILAQSQSDTSFLDKLQKIIEIRRSFEIESQAKNPALLSYKKTEGSTPSLTVDLAITYLGFTFENGKVKPFVQVDFSGSGTKNQNELLTTGISASIYTLNAKNSRLRIHPDLFYTRDFLNKLNIYRTAITLEPEIRNFIVPIVNITRRQFSEESIDGDWLVGLNPNLTFKLKETDYDGVTENSTVYFTELRADFAIRKWYLQVVVMGSGEKTFGDINEIRYEYGGTITLFFDEKERSSLNAMFQQKGSDLNQALKTFTLGFGLKL